MNPFTRRRFLGNAARGALGLAGLRFTGCGVSAAMNPQSGRRPNILLAIADDWSWPHASIAGTRGVQTPIFDRVAHEGVLFTHAFCAAPHCAPNRAALFTGRHAGQLEEASQQDSLFPSKFPVYPDLLEDAGYHVGFTGKGWGPGNWRRGGRKRNPAGPEYNQREFDLGPSSGIHWTDYAANFREFLLDRPEHAPFCFWYGGHEPHRPYEKGVRIKIRKEKDGRFRAGVSA